jgi:hypothetical protein
MPAIQTKHSSVMEAVAVFGIHRTHSCHGKITRFVVTGKQVVPSSNRLRLSDRFRLT